MTQLLTQLKSSLEQNPNLNEEAKESLFILVQRMHQKMNLPTDLLIERLKNVSLEQSSKLLDQDAYHYNVAENNVRFRLDKMDDQTNTLCQAVLEMAIVRQAGKGIDHEDVVAIKRGSLEIFANYLVQNNGEYGISEDEQIIVNLMDILTEGKILEGFVKDDSRIIKSALQMSNLLVVNCEANYNSQARKQGRQSHLGEIEKTLINRFFEQSPEKIQGKITDFESNLVMSPHVMGNPNQYRSLSEVAVHYQAKKASYIAQMGLIQASHIEQIEKAK